MDNKQSLKDIRTLLKRIERKRRNQRKTHVLLYRDVNKAYKTINWNSDIVSKEDAKRIFENTTLPVQKKMRDYGWLRFIPRGEKGSTAGVYSKSNVENLFLIQELMCYMDDEYWDFSRLKKSKWNPKKVPFYHDSLYLGKIKIADIPVTKIEKCKLVTEWLKKREFLFDLSNKNHPPMIKILEFIKTNLINGKIDKWDFYLKRFLYKYTK